jgi:hypothetical protein
MEIDNLCALTRHRAQSKASKKCGTNFLLEMAFPELYVWQTTIFSQQKQDLQASAPNFYVGSHSPH